MQYLAFVPLLRRLKEEFLFCPKRSVPHSIKTYKLSTVRVLLLPEWILPVNPTIGRLITSSPLWYCLINQFAVVSSRQKEKAIFCMKMTRQATERHISRTDADGCRSSICSWAVHLIEFNVKRSPVQMSFYIYSDVAQQCMAKVAGTIQIVGSSSLKHPKKKEKIPETSRRWSSCTLCGNEVGETKFKREMIEANICNKSVHSTVREITPFKSAHSPPAEFNVRLSTCNWAQVPGIVATIIRTSFEVITTYRK